MTSLTIRSDQVMSHQCLPASLHVLSEATNDWQHNAYLCKHNVDDLEGQHGTLEAQQYSATVFECNRTRHKHPKNRTATPRQGMRSLVDLKPCACHGVVLTTLSVDVTCTTAEGQKYAFTKHVASTADVTTFFATRGSQITRLSYNTASRN